jgi:hypothetical protein
VSTASPSEGAGPPTIEGRRAYLQWSCDRLASALEGRGSREHPEPSPRLLPSHPSAPSPGRHQGRSRRLRHVHGRVARLDVHRCDRRTRLLVSGHGDASCSGVQLAIFTRDDEPEHAATKDNFEYRFERARNNLLDTVRAAQESGDELGRWRRISLHRCHGRRGGGSVFPRSHQARLGFNQMSETNPPNTAVPPSAPQSSSTPPASTPRPTEPVAWVQSGFDATARPAPTVTKQE